MLSSSYYITDENRSHALPPHRDAEPRADTSRIATATADKLLGVAYVKAVASLSTLIANCYEGSSMLPMNGAEFDTFELTPLLSDLLSIAYLRLPAANGSSGDAAELRLLTMAEWCRTASLSISSTREGADESFNDGQFESVAEQLQFALSNRFLSQVSQHEQCLYSSTSADSRLLNAACTAYITEHESAPLSSSITASSGLPLVSMVASLPSVSAVRHFVKRFVLLPFLICRSRALQFAFSKWRRRFNQMSTTILGHVFNAWRQFVHDPYAVEERRKKEVFLVGAVAALRKRRVKLRHQRADQIKLLRTCFDAWRLEGIPIQKFERRQSALKCHTILQAMKFKQVAAIADRYYLLQLFKRTLAIWNARLHAKRANAGILSICLKKLRDAALVKRFQRAHQLRQTFSKMRTAAALQCWLRTNPRSNLGTKRAVIRRWRTLYLERMADQQYAAHLHKETARLLGNQMALQARERTVSKRSKTSIIHFCFHKWRRSASLELPNDRRLNDTCTTFISAKVFLKWRNRLALRRSQREADELCVRLSELAKMGIAMRRWKARLSANKALRATTATREFHAKIACLFQWQKAFKTHSKNRLALEELSSNVAEKLTLRTVIRKWHLELRTKRNLLFPGSMLSDHTLSGPPFTGSGLNDSAIAEGLNKTRLVLVSDAELHAGRDLRRSILFSGAVISRGQLAVADHSYLKRLAKGSLIRWASLWRLACHRRGRLRGDLSRAADDYQSMSDVPSAPTWTTQRKANVVVVGRSTSSSRPTSLNASVVGYNTRRVVQVEGARQTPFSLMNIMRQQQTLDGKGGHRQASAARHGSYNYYQNAYADDDASIIVEEV